MTIRLVLADDHPIVLDGLVQVFSLEPDFKVLACAKNGEDALRAVRQFRPDILVLDLRMPGKDGLTVLREMKRERRSPHVVVLTAMDDDDVVEAIRLGARGIVLKDMAPRLLVQCIREVYAGNKWIERASATHAVETLLKREAREHDTGQILTPRELEIARMITKGLHNKAIASKLAITEGTAKLHLHHVYEKLNVDGRMELIRYLQRHGIE